MSRSVVRDLSLAPLYCMLSNISTAKVSMELLEIVRQHAELLDRTIKYERDYAFDYFGFKAQIFFLFFPL